MDEDREMLGKISNSIAEGKQSPWGSRIASRGKTQGCASAGLLPRGWTWFHWDGINRSISLVSPSFPWAFLLGTEQESKLAGLKNPKIPLRCWTKTAVGRDQCRSRQRCLGRAVDKEPSSSTIITKNPTMLILQHFQTRIPKIFSVNKLFSL